MAYSTHNKYVLVAAKNKVISSIIDPSTNKVLASTPVPMKCHVRVVAYDPIQENTLYFYLDNPTHKDSLSLQLY
jgi:DNA-binding beta-propeller fold protein YncE